MSDISYLWSLRERPALGSRRWCIVWAKRALHFVALLKIVMARRSFRARGVQVGALSILDRFTLEGPASHLSVGEHCFISGSTEIVALDQVRIGSRVVINDRVTILTASHHVGDPGWRSFKKPVRIDDYAWIAVGATILPGVTIGYGAVVGAGAVVAKDVPPLAVATGNPAVIRLNARPADLCYDPVALLPAFEAWIGRRADPAGPANSPVHGVEPRP
ncbi:acyltransferase [Variovorax ginsengisoli]|uniref:Acyltransferase n=1 Tax=Variovorax ginsengisoli TaxID=363844 RepID=A0ABT8S2N0_9BURK|nr:acyltransferase [Variovorax ginsengisoli]MDN8612451.1 acyltransferase [Variovorax ginsengisoli]MDO1531621.1 acyltransferase [Variovorax ginsengisoli]